MFEMPGLRIYILYLFGINIFEDEKMGWRKLATRNVTFRLICNTQSLKYIIDRRPTDFKAYL